MVGPAFVLPRLGYAISGGRLRPPSLGSRPLRRNLAVESKGLKECNRTRRGGAASIGPRGVDDVGYRKTANGLYGNFQGKKDNGRNREWPTRGAAGRAEVEADPPIRAKGEKSNIQTYWGGG